jgi:1-acyl-sn-glycerol-3-phosphate acyltransferase
VSSPGLELEWVETVQTTMDKIVRRMAGEYHEDEYGFDEEFTETVFPLFEFLYHRWWRVQVDGVRNLPGHGRALLVANHSGTIFPFDAVMIGTAVQKEHPLPRWTRALVLNWAFDLPFVSWFIRRIGGVAANPANLNRLLSQDQPVMVFPEGAKGFGKPFSERYRVQRFGRGGFVEAALETGSPIVPVAVVGAEEIYPKLGESGTLARIAGAPYVPITPTFPLLGPLGLLPLPSRWRIEFLEPIDLSGYGPGAGEDRSLVFDISEQVREMVQEALYRGLVTRGSAFL